MSDLYDNYAPAANKRLNEDGSITTLSGEPVDTDTSVAEYNQRQPFSNKFLQPDGTLALIEDILPSGGGGGSAVESVMAWKPEISEEGIIYFTKTVSDVAPTPKSIIGPKGDKGDLGDGIPTFIAENSATAKNDFIVSSEQIPESFDITAPNFLVKLILRSDSYANNPTSNSIRVQIKGTWFSLNRMINDSTGSSTVGIRDVQGFGAANTEANLFKRYATYNSLLMIGREYIPQEQFSFLKSTGYVAVFSPQYNTDADLGIGNSAWCYYESSFPENELVYIRIQSPYASAFGYKTCVLPNNMKVLVDASNYSGGDGGGMGGAPPYYGTELTVVLQNKSPKMTTGKTYPAIRVGTKLYVTDITDNIVTYTSTAAATSMAKGSIPNMFPGALLYVTFNSGNTNTSPVFSATHGYGNTPLVCPGYSAFPTWAIPAGYTGVFLVTEDDKAIMLNPSTVNIASQIDTIRYPVVTCSTADITVAKTAPAPYTGFTLTIGVRITVIFTNGNKAANPTLAVGSTAAKKITSNLDALTADDGKIPPKHCALLEYDGTSWMLLNPAKAGIPGADGTAATVSAGTVTMVESDAPAKVTNSGTPSAAVFDFEIPKSLGGASEESDEETLFKNMLLSLFTNGRIDNPDQFKPVDLLDGIEFTGGTYTINYVGGSVIVGSKIITIPPFSISKGIFASSLDEYSSRTLLFMLRVDASGAKPVITTSAVWNEDFSASFDPGYWGDELFKSEDIQEFILGFVYAQSVGENLDIVYNDVNEYYNNAMFPIARLKMMDTINEATAQTDARLDYHSRLQPSNEYDSPHGLSYNAYNTQLSVFPKDAPAFRLVQKNMIQLYNGTVTQFQQGPVAGWAVCDGTNGTPNLSANFLPGTCYIMKL